MQEPISKQTLETMVATTIRNNHGMIPHELAHEIMNVVWPEYAKMIFEMTELEKEIADTLVSS